MRRSVVGLLAVTPLALGAAWWLGFPHGSASTTRDLLGRYCTDCHNTSDFTAELVIEPRDLDKIASDPAHWEKVVRKLRTEEMPPDGPRPKHDQYLRAAAFLEAELDAAAAAEPQPGEVPAFRRLTRTEYRNAIRDLLALDGLPAELDFELLLPADNAASGFDNIADLLFVSPVVMERYIAAAQKISRIDLRAPVMVNIHQLSETAAGRAYRRFVVRARGRSTHICRSTPSTSSRSGQRPQLPGPRDRVSVDGVHVCAGRHAGRQPGDAATRQRAGDVSRTARGGPVSSASFVRTLRRSTSIYAAVCAAAACPRSRWRDSRTVCGDRARGHAEPQPHLHLPAERRCRRRNAVRGANLARACSPGVSPARNGRRRRRPHAVLRDGPRRRQLRHGTPIRARAPAREPAVPLRIEREPAEPGAHPVSDIELASRLSFFLWSSIPDDELLAAAEKGSLREPAVLRAQVQRMLADARSEAMVTNFAAQWLFLRDVAVKDPDIFLFPDHDPSLRAALERETELFVDSVFRSGGSVLELLTAKHTFVNERLAKHYGIPYVQGSYFRRVELGPESRRAGLLGQGSILTVTSYAARTSPVLRGKYVLDNLLASPPPPPPPDVPSLATEDKTDGAPLTLREAMIRHRADPVCAGCHAKMDPIGFALEHFDAVGRWRDDDAGMPIESKSELADGRVIDGPEGVQAFLTSRPELFVNALTEKLMMYALGRNVQYYDAPAVRAVVHAAAERNYEFSAIVEGIVASVPFQMRAGRTAAPPKENEQ
jgi:hypothetical protein